MTRSPGKRPFTLTERRKAGLTKRAQLEEEFGLPFEQAVRLRRIYYQQGYTAARSNYEARLHAMACRLEGALAALRRANEAA